MDNLTRSQIMTLCKNAIVPVDMWSNKFSYAGQKMIDSVYRCTMAGFNYYLHSMSNNRFLVIEFLPFPGCVAAANKIKPLKKEVYNMNKETVAYYSKIKKIEFKYSKGIDIKNIPLIGFIPTNETLESYIIASKDWTTDDMFHALCNKSKPKRKQKNLFFQSVFNYLG